MIPLRRLGPLLALSVAAVAIIGPESHGRKLCPGRSVPCVTKSSAGPAGRV